MFKIALRELRYHPQRYIASLVAVMISVAFLQAASVLLGTMTNQTVGQQMIALRNEDVQVKITTEGENPDIKIVEVGQQLEALDGVEAASWVDTRTLAIEGENTTLIRFNILPSSPFLTSKLVSGQWPSQAGEVALSQGALDQLGLKLGDNLPTAVGESSGLKVVGVTDDPTAPGMNSQNGYWLPQQVLSQEGTDYEGTWQLKTTLDARAVQAEVEKLPALASGKFTVKALSQADVIENAQKGAVNNMTKWMAYGFSGIAALVGIIVIANTFTILLTQRRRQIGLLRAIGASGSQLRRSVALEAVLLGIVGSALGIGVGIGVGAIGSAALGVLDWGLAVPLSETLAALLFGVIITLIAAFFPSRKATQVPPLAALQTVPTGDEKRKASVTRGIVCAIVLAAGLALIVMAFRPSAQALLFGVGGCLLAAIALLFAAPIYLPWILKLVGVLVRPFGPTARLAAKNVQRNPRRASATASALMLAIGLIVTLQVGVASSRDSLLDFVKTQAPVDITLIGQVSDNDDQYALESVPGEIRQEVKDIEGVGTEADMSGVLGWTDAKSQFGSIYKEDGKSMVTLVEQPANLSEIIGRPVQALGDMEIMPAFGWDVKPGEKFPVTVGNNTYELTVVSRDGVQWEDSFVSAATLAKLGKPIPDVRSYFKVPDHSKALDMMGALQKVQEHFTYNGIGGSLLISAQLETAFGMILALATALMAVAVLIALVGVANTLSLSVIERTRETGLLRALGMQRSSLRLMLLIEALILGGVGTVVGIAMGTGAAWVGLKSIESMLGEGTRSGFMFSFHLSFDPVYTIGLIAAAIGAAALASVLPGRRAAKVAPVRALAELG
ncbi:MAG: FtsX-like permease family protein [Propionibacteriaceae bacterium]|jgi:putative ABC transport system permease protein|nr:FtsX-like permease family protein [Propionibacteriaceae bacterium]